MICKMNFGMADTLFLDFMCIWSLFQNTVEKSLTRTRLTD